MKNPTGLILFILMVSSISLFAQKEEVLILATEDINIEGTLLIPVSEKKIPVVLFISGSGPTDRDGNNRLMKNNSLKMLATGLAESGIATLRYDKRGVGKSAGDGVDESELRFNDYIDDAALWIDYLNNDDRFNEVMVLGHSEGSLIGMVASQNHAVTKFISLAGVGEPANKIIRQQLEKLPSEIQQQANPILEKLETGGQVDDVPMPLYSLFRPDVQPYLISWFKYDPKEELAKLKIPILILQGTSDIQVDVSNAEFLGAANERAKVEIIEGMNHVLKQSELDQQSNLLTYNNPDLPLSDGVIEILTRFIY